MIPRIEGIDKTLARALVDDVHKTGAQHETEDDEHGSERRIQRQVADKLLLEVGYSGTNSHKLWKRYNQNQAVFDPTGTIPIQNRLPFPKFDPGILTSANDSNGNYNGGFIKLEKSYSNGLFFLSGYTFSKAIDNNSGEIEANDTRDRTNKGLDRGRSRFDQRHRFGTSFGYALPFGSGKKLLTNIGGITGFVVGGWNVQGIVSLLSGAPFGVSAASVVRAVSPDRARDHRRPE